MDVWEPTNKKKRLEHIRLFAIYNPHYTLAYLRSKQEWLK